MWTQTTPTIDLPSRVRNARVQVKASTHHLPAPMRPVHTVTPPPSSNPLERLIAGLLPHRSLPP